MVTATATQAKTSTPALPRTVGVTIDKLWELREQKRKIETDLKAVEADMGLLEEHLSGLMEREGVDKSTGKHASVSFSMSVIATNPEGRDPDESWAEFMTFVAKKKYWHLVEKRVSAPAYRELLDAGVKVPGRVPFTKKRMNLRALATA
jgi:hypothetical protein